MFFALQQIRHNRERERRREELVAQIRQDLQAEREHSQARQEEHQQQLAALLAQNQQMYARLLELVERRIGSSDAPSN